MYHAVPIFPANIRN